MSTINFFKEIVKIPRESGNEEKIANYLCEFAQKRNLEYFKDSYNNVLIKKKTKNSKPIILQAHTDMVCEKEKDYPFDFKNDSIELIIEDGFIKANKTTLGADNGVGIAQILNILDMPMGTGKTTGIINYIKENKNKKYIFVSPYLKQPELFKSLKFNTPSDDITKLSSL